MISLVYYREGAIDRLVKLYKSTVRKTGVIFVELDLITFAFEDLRTNQFTLNKHYANLICG